MNLPKPQPLYRRHYTREGEAKRLRGRKGVAQRLRRLAAEPLCRDCLAKDPPKVTASTVPDHIIPFALGGTDDDSNIRCLCKKCHDIRTAEQFGRARAVIGPDGWPVEDTSISNAASERRMPSDLRPSAIPLTIVCGPPGSGKSTYINEHIGPNDLLIDFDTIQQRLSGRPVHQTSREYLEPTLNERNRMLRALAHDTTHERAWFVVSAADPHERATWAKRLGGDVVTMDTPLAECIRRIEADPSRIGHVDRMVKAARDWRRKNKRE